MIKEVLLGLIMLLIVYALWLVLPEGLVIQYQVYSLLFSLLLVFFVVFMFKNFLR